ncbi:MAG: NCS2 family permease [Verrucomicrobiae bacterium]|nr:NCS2 family permease [Verrucomicrobiae bacterium]
MKNFVRGDIDGFFGLFIDNLVQLMVIATLCPVLCGLPIDFVTTHILPGAALSILAGNLFYGWQARRLARKTNRNDITALPYGINTPTVFAYIFLIMAPIYRATNNADLAWRAGLFACLLSGIMEILGAFCADWLRRHTPRAALLSALAGVAITFIAMGFIFQIFASPALAILPMLFILVSYTSKLNLPLPAGLTAVLIGTIIAWLLRAFHLPYFTPTTQSYVFNFYFPHITLNDTFSLIKSPMAWQYFSIILPMGLFNIIGSLQNLESAEAAGDSYPTRSSMFINGFGSCVAACLGSPFPTTIYIGHPGWKAMGARSSYSILNGVVITLFCSLGMITLLLNWIPLEATLGILLWIGIIITAQAFQAVPKSHALAVALGLIPTFAAWALQLIETTLQAAGTTLYETIAQFGSALAIHGVIALNQGFLLTSTLLAAFLVFIIEKQWQKAAFTLFIASLLAWLGLIHAYQLTANGIQNSLTLGAAPEFAYTYLASGMAILILSRIVKIRHESPQKNSSR